MKQEIAAGILLTTFIAAGQTPPDARKPVVPESEAAVDTRPSDPAASRAVWMPTALPKPRKNLQATGFDLGLWHIEGSVSDQIDAGSFVLLPIGVLAVAPTIRWHKSLDDRLHVGAVGQVGVVASLIGSGHAFLYGVGPMLTLGDARKYLNFSTLVYGLNGGDEGGMLILPSVSAGVQVGRRVKLNAELTSVNAIAGVFDDDVSNGDDSVGEVFAFLYGARIFSESGAVFGDISFIAPLGSDVGNFYKVLPIGFPLINLGFTF